MKVYSIPPIDLAFFFLVPWRSPKPGKQNVLVQWCVSCHFYPRVYWNFVQFISMFFRLAGHLVDGQVVGTRSCEHFQTRDSSAAAWTVDVRKSVRLRFWSYWWYYSCSVPRFQNLYLSYPSLSETETVITAANDQRHEMHNDWKKIKTEFSQW